MIKIIILKKLRDDIYKIFKKDSMKVYSLIEGLKKNPRKGKKLGIVGDMSIRELKYKSYRFYFILDSHKLYLFTRDQTVEVLLKFVRMSKKNNQQEVIDEIKRILKEMGKKVYKKN